jgi:hypothetical protein
MGRRGACSAGIPMDRRLVSRLVFLALVGASSPVLAAPLSGVVAGYDPERGTFVGTADGRWELNPYAMIQLTHVTSGQGSHVETTGFHLHAAKFILHGHVVDPSLTYHFQVNAGEGRVVGEDVYLHWRATPWLSLLVGQAEVTFNRQHMTLEAYQELVDRSIVDARFTLQRDIGAVATLSDPDRRYEATIGLWNGARQNAPNDDTGYLGTLRLAYNPLGPIVFREADLEDSRAPKVSLAVAGAYNPSASPLASPPCRPPRRCITSPKAWPRLRCATAGSRSRTSSTSGVRRSTGPRTPGTPAASLRWVSSSCPATCSSSHGSRASPAL